MNFKYLLTLAGLCFCASLSGQIKIGDNPQNLDAASVLELESNDRVLVITRISDAQMNTLVPLQGAMVYNTDVQCIFYFDGTTWINLCDSLGLTFTTDPIVNTASTIVITENGDNINFEVGEISSANILDFSINSIDIQNNSITDEKLAPDSVGSEELQDNTVTDAEIDYNIVTLNDFINDAGFITSANIVSGNANNAITDNGGAFYDDSQVISDVAANTAAIAADGDTSATNELQSLSLSVDQLTITNGNTVDLSSLNNAGSDNQNLTGASLNPGDILQIDIQNGNSATVDLSSLGGTGNDNQQILDFSFNPETRFLSITLEDGGSQDIDFTGLVGSPMIIDGTIKSVDIEPGAVENANIDALAVTTDKIFPSPINDQVLTTVLGNVEWAELPPGGNQNLSQVLAQGNDANTLGITNLTTNALDNSAAATVGYVTAAIASGTPTLTDGSIFVGSATNTPQQLPISGDATMDNSAVLTIQDNAVNSAKIADATIQAEDLNQMGATDGDVLEWDDTTNGWITTAGAASDTDDQVVDQFDITSDQLNISLQDDGVGPTSVDLSPYEESAAILANTALITNHTSTDLDLSATNEIELPVGGNSGQVLSTDGAGVYTWINNGSGTDTDDQTVDQFDIVGDQLSLSLQDDGVGPTSVDLSPYEESAAILANTTLITNHTSTDLDLSATNEIELPVGGNSGQVLSTDGAGVYTWINNGSGTDTDDQTVDQFDIVGDQLSLSLQDDGVGPTSVDLSPYEESAAILANTTLITNHTSTDLDISATNEIELPVGGNSGQVLSTDGAGVYTWINNGSGIDTDDQTVDQFDIVGDQLSLSLQDDGVGPTSVDLSPYLDNQTAAEVLYDHTTSGLTATTSQEAIDELAGSSNNNLSNSNLTQTAADRTYNLDGGNLRITGTGNMRIGSSITALTNKLHVEGTIKAAGIRNTFGTLPNSVAYSFDNDSNTGMYRAAADEIGLVTSGSEALRIDSNQNVGVGTTTPTSTLETGGSFATAIQVTSGVVNLGTNDHTIIFNNNGSISLPSATSFKGRIYIIKNPSFTVGSNNYLDSIGTLQSSIPNGVVQLQSDGTNWQQIN